MSKCHNMHIRRIRWFILSVGYIRGTLFLLLLQEGCFVRRVVSFYLFKENEQSTGKYQQKETHTDTPLCSGCAILPITPTANWILYSLSHTGSESRISFIIQFPIHFHFFVAWLSVCVCACVRVCV